MKLLSRVAVATGVAVSAVAGSVATATPAAAYWSVPCNVDCGPHSIERQVPCTGMWGPYTWASTDQCVVMTVDGYVDLEAPRPASGLSGVPDQEGALLRWAHSSSHDVRHYRIEVAITAEGRYADAGVAGSHDELGNWKPPPSALRVPQPPSTIRHYRVIAVDDRGRESTPTSPVSVRTIAAAPTPTGATGVATSAHTARVAWNANQPAPTAYVVQIRRYGYHQVDDGGQYRNAYGEHFVTICRTNSTNCDLGWFSPGSTYRFLVRAENAHGRLSDPALVEVKLPSS